MSEKNFKNYLNQYEFDYTLLGSGENIKFKPLTTSDMKSLLEYEDETSMTKLSEAMDKMIENSVTTDGFDVNELYLRDRFSLLIEIRKKTKGEVYQFEFKCPECGSQEVDAINLDELETKTLESGEKNGKINIADGVEITIGHLKRKDEREALEDVESRNVEEKRKEFEYWINLMASSIQSITTPEGEDNNLEFEDKKFIINSVTQKTLEDMGNWFDKNWFGVNFQFTMRCKSCETSKTYPIPMNQLFT